MNNHTNDTNQHRRTLLKGAGASRIIGVTGDSQSLAHVAKAWRVNYQLSKQPPTKKLHRLTLYFYLSA